MYLSHLSPHATPRCWAIVFYEEATWSTWALIPTDCSHMFQLGFAILEVGSIQRWCQDVPGVYIYIYHKYI